jgi:hypothetical protein
MRNSKSFTNFEVILSRRTKKRLKKEVIAYKVFESYEVCLNKTKHNMH